MLSRNTRSWPWLAVFAAVVGILAVNAAIVAASDANVSSPREEAERAAPQLAEPVGPAGAKLPHPEALPRARERAATPDTTTITIETFGSNLAFEPGSFSAKAGTIVRVVYVNEGTLPHNFVIARTDDDVDALAAASYQAQESGFVPLELEDKMIAHTALASPGQTVEVTFTAPPPGEYTFVCLVPGHYNMMLGTFTSLE